MPLNGPHRVALLAAVLLAMGGLGPWATGVWVTDPILGEPTFEARSTFGGWPVAVAAAVAVSALLLVPDVRVRAHAAAGTFGIGALLCGVGWLTQDQSLWFNIQVFSGWASVEPGWGLLLATVAALAGVAASLAGAPRRDPWRGAPF